MREPIRKREKIISKKKKKRTSYRNAQKGWADIW